MREVKKNKKGKSFRLGVNLTDLCNVNVIDENLASKLGCTAEEGQGQSNVPGSPSTEAEGVSAESTEVMEDSLEVKKDSGFGASEDAGLDEPPKPIKVDKASKEVKVDDSVKSSEAVKADDSVKAEGSEESGELVNVPLNEEPKGGESGSLVLAPDSMEVKDSVLADKQSSKKVKAAKNAKNKKVPMKSKIKYALIFSFLVLLGLSLFLPTEVQKGSLSPKDFLAEVSAGNIDYVVVSKSSSVIDVYYKEGIRLDTEVASDGTLIEPTIVDGRRVETTVCTGEDDYYKVLGANGVDIRIARSRLGVVLSFLSVLPMLLVVIVLLWYFKSSGILSKHKTLPIRSTVTFDDVAGLKEEKEELKFALDSLLNKDMHAAGVKPVKGVLLEGPPGTGKTLLAKALAGEANINFLSYSSSSFVEMFVGLGAKRVREMFKAAEAAAPCIVFLDELDALASHRASVGNSEADQTLIALLEKMDGISTKAGILFIGATNRVKDLDPAILRPGRFDKVLHIDIPGSKEDRVAIIEVHLADKKLAEDLSVDFIAKQCYGLSGADIAEVLNDAVVESFKRGTQGVITHEALDSAIMKLAVHGVAKGKHCEEDKVRVAYHELGHALMNVRFGRKVLKVSIQPYSSGVGGITQTDVEAESRLKTAEQFEEDIKILYAGRAAEEVFLGSVSVGASNDLYRATELIRSLVMELGLAYDADNAKGSLLNLEVLSSGKLGFSNGKAGLSIDSIVPIMDEISKRLYEDAKSYLQGLDRVEVDKLLAELVEDELILDFNKKCEVVGNV